MRNFLIYYTSIFTIIMFFGGCKAKKVYTFNSSNNNYDQSKSHFLKEESNECQLKTLSSINEGIYVLNNEKTLNVNENRVEKYKVKEQIDIVKNIEEVSGEELSGVQKRVLKKIHKKAQKQDGDNQVVALLLCWFVGIFGIHRFYLGYPVIGILQLITLGGCGIWTFIDLIRILIGDLKPAGRQYGSTIDDAL